jgi:hypothetical protein
VGWGNGIEGAVGDVGTCRVTGRGKRVVLHDWAGTHDCVVDMAINTAWARQGLTRCLVTSAEGCEDARAARKADVGAYPCHRHGRLVGGPCRGSYAVARAAPEGCNIPGLHMEASEAVVRLEWVYCMCVVLIVVLIA